MRSCVVGGQRFHPVIELPLTSGAKAPVTGGGEMGFEGCKSSTVRLNHKVEHGLALYQKYAVNDGVSFL